MTNTSPVVELISHANNNLRVACSTDTVRLIIAPLAKLRSELAETEFHTKTGFSRSEVARCIEELETLLGNNPTKQGQFREPIN